MQTDSEYEFWGARASLLVTDTASFSEIEFGGHNQTLRYDGVLGSIVSGSGTLDDLLPFIMLLVTPFMTAIEVSPESPGARTGTRRAC